MATQENIKPAAEAAERDALNEASMALGRAWGLAETLCFQAGERPNDFDVEGVMRVIHSLVGQAKAKVGARAVDLEIDAALAVCCLVMVDSQESAYDPGSSSSWALEAVPSAIQRAKDAVDTVPWGRPQLKAA
ncbi:MAG TPA: hypothetical protein PKZ22_05940 [Accumulibacter sp.]|jgi:hypothetical protein|nr:hypothetical protein [Accumulibacter sp.]